MSNSGESNCSCFAVPGRPDPSLSPQSQGLFCALCCFSDLKGSLCEEKEYFQEKRGQSCLVLSGAHSRALAWSPFFVLWICSLSLGFFCWTAECSGWSHSGACYLWPLAEGWAEFRRAGGSRTACPAAREQQDHPEGRLCFSQSARKHSLSLVEIRMLLLGLKTPKMGQKWALLSSPRALMLGPLLGNKPKENSLQSLRIAFTVPRGLFILHHYFPRYFWLSGCSCENSGLVCTCPLLELVHTTKIVILKTWVHCRQKNILVRDPWVQLGFISSRVFYDPFTWLYRFYWVSQRQGAKIRA